MSISSPETHVGPSELPGRRFSSERGIKGRWWKWTSRAEEEPGERQEQVVEMGKYPDHLDSPPALSSFSLQDLNSLRTMTPLKILSPKIYASRCTCTILPTIPVAIQTPPRNLTLLPPTMDLKLQPYHDTAFQSTDVEAEKRKTQAGWERRGAYKREEINIMYKKERINIMLFCLLQ